MRSDRLITSDMFSGEGSSKVFSAVSIFEEVLRIFIMALIRAAIFFTLPPDWFCTVSVSVWISEASNIASDVPASFL